eukprot:CAMPEP_0185544480 /NCGR_PEP_ID=MMETSP1381-20130426/4102_1 /TAXON_ID=298111 /ORGANISM="Pavlova sp., Strain CCMP459" /LENGTH=57 /DNA_ID=CAMNT_0028156705 /DNA_START=447 /DNA_END=620 /DNA_ORIENTATION=-
MYKNQSPMKKAADTCLSTVGPPSSPSATHGNRRMRMREMAVTAQKANAPTEKVSVPA